MPMPFLSNSKSIPFFKLRRHKCQDRLRTRKISNLIYSFFLFISDDSVDVLDAMITNMVHVIDALARFGVLQFGQGGQFSADLSAALLHCEATVDRTRNWRLQVRNDLNRLIDHFNQVILTYQDLENIILEIKVNANRMTLTHTVQSLALTRVTFQKIRFFVF